MPWNACTLQDKLFVAELRKSIKGYFTLHTGSVDSNALLWEAFKVTIRGHCISKQNGVLKTLRAHLDTLEKEIDTLEQQTAI